MRQQNGTPCTKINCITCKHVKHFTNFLTDCKIRNAQSTDTAPVYSLLSTKTGSVPLADGMSAKFADVSKINTGFNGKTSAKFDDASFFFADAS